MTYTWAKEGREYMLCCSWEGVWQGEKMLNAYAVFVEAQASRLWTDAHNGPKKGKHKK
jgi:hypothetical protein